jgi:hypothetical protein
VGVRAATSAAYTNQQPRYAGHRLQHLVAVMLVDKTVSSGPHTIRRAYKIQPCSASAKVQLVPRRRAREADTGPVAIVEITWLTGRNLASVSNTHRLRKTRCRVMKWSPRRAAGISVLGDKVRKAD